MNILYLTYSYLPALGGVQRSVHNLAREFTRRGHRIIVVCDGPRPLAYQRVPPAPVLALRIPYPLHRTWAKRTEANLLDSVNLTALTALCRRNRIEIVHCHLINVDTRYAMALKRRLGIKVIITLRGGEFHHWIADNPARRDYVRQMLESADAVTALSRSQIDDARALAPSAACEAVVITNPCDPDAITRLASPQTGVAIIAPYILFAGRMAEQKRVDLLVAAYHEIIAQSPRYPYDLVLAGSGSLLSQVREQARNGPAAPRIRFAGTCRYEDSLALIRDAAVLVLPSGQSEGCPNVILEAMALGTPVIVSDHGPLLELVTDGVNGLVFPCGEVAALKDCLYAMARDEERRSRYAAAGRTYLQANHRFEPIADAYEELYRRLATPSRTSATGQA